MGLTALLGEPGEHRRAPARSQAPPPAMGAEWSSAGAWQSCLCPCVPVRGYFVTVIIRNGRTSGSFIWSWKVLSRSHLTSLWESHISIRTLFAYLRVLPYKFADLRGNVLFDLSIYFTSSIFCLLTGYLGFFLL